MGVSRLTMEVPQNESSNLQKFEPFWARQMKFSGLAKIKLKHDIILECRVKIPPTEPKKLKTFTAQARHIKFSGQMTIKG